MSAIGPGDLVERIRDGIVPVGTILTVRAVEWPCGPGACPRCKDCVGPNPGLRFYVAEYELDADPRPSCACGWRPVQRRPWLAELLNVETPVSIDHPERVDG